MTAIAPIHRRRWAARVADGLLVLPGVVWLAIFFLVPMVAMVSVSLQTGSLETGFSQTFNVQTYIDMISAYHVQLIRSLVYGLMTTLVTILLAYPMATGSRSTAAGTSRHTCS